MARGRRKPKRQTAAPGKRGQAAAPGGAAPEAADLPVGESAGGAAPKAAAPDTPPPEAPPAERDPAAPVGLPSRGGTVEIEARPDDPIVLAVPGPQAVTVTRRNGDLAFDLGSEGALLIRGFLSLHEEGRAPALSVGDAALPPDRILAALRAGEAQYGNGSGVARPAEPEDMTVVAVPSGEGVGVVGLLAPDGLAFEMPPIGSGEAAEALPPLATDKVFAMPEDLATPHPIVGRLFDEDDPGAPTRYLSTTGSFRTAQGGSVMIGVDGLFEYRSPEGGFDGEDSFAFTVSDGVRSETATVTIVAAPIGAAGEMTAARGTRGAGRGGAAEPGGGPGHVYETVQDSALEVGPERGLLADCFAAGKLAAQVLSAGTIVTAEGGSVEMDADGAFAYMPRPRFVGRDHFAVTMEPGDGEAERILGVVIEVGEAEAAPSPERAPRFAVMEIPLGPRPAGRERASVTVALAESREVVRPAHYLALDYHDGTAWTPFANGGEVPLAPGQEVLTLRGLALDEAGNPLFQTPDAFEVAATAPDGEDLIAGEPHCWLADPADDGEEDLAAAAPADDDESGAAGGEGAYSYFDIPMAAEDRAAGIVTLLVSYDADLPDGVRLQLEYLDGFAWIPFDNGGVVPTEEDRLHVRALLSAADGSALPADGDRFRFSISRPAALPPGVGADAEEGPEGDAGPAPAAAEVDLPLPPAPPGTRAVTLWVTDDEADGESLDMAYFADGEWHAFASGETLPVGAEADGIRLRLALLDGEGRPLPVDLERFRFEALPVPPADGETGAEPADAPEARAGAEPDFEPGGEPDAEPAAEPGEPVDAAMDAAVRQHGDIEAEPPEPGPDAAEAAAAEAPAAPADRPDFVYYGESVDPTGGRDLPLAFDALAWAWPADEDWPLPWRGAADAGARRTDAGADAPSADGAEEEAETEAEAALAAVEAHPDFDPSETFALIFNIDVSGSMAWSFDGRQRPSLMYEESRLGVAVQAIKDLLALFVEEGFAGRTRVRLQPFTNRFVEDDAASFPNLTDMPAIHRYLDGLFAGGITRYEPVMEAAAQWLAEPENRCRYNRIYVLSDGGDNVGYQPISTTVRQLYTAYNGPGQPNLDIFAYGLGAGADELEPERLGALKTGKVVLDPLAPSEAAEKASVILVTAPDNLFAVLADTAPSGDSAPRPSYGAAGGVVMGGEGESDRPVGVVRNRLVLNWQLGDEGTIAHPSVSTVSDFQVGDVGHDPLASVADISGLLPANLVRRPRDLGAYVQAGVRGRDLEIHVDVDGSIQGFQPQQIIILRGCGAAFSPESESDSILKTLIETGNLVIASQR